MRARVEDQKPGKKRLSFPFFTTERVSGLPRVTQLVREKVQISTDMSFCCHPFQTSVAGNLYK